MTTELTSLGLNLILDFVSKEEELNLIENIDRLPKSKDSDLKEGRNGREIIQRFGTNDSYKTHIVSEVIPDFLDNISKKIITNKLLTTKPNHITVNHYLKDQTIPPHIDNKSSGEVITVLSLGSDATMVFTNNGNKKSLLLPSRSLIQLKNQIRNDWQHTVIDILDKRYSIVFRAN